jgi:pyruvate-ferredoxin/flavodoxin oxidoreductase
METPLVNTDQIKAEENSQLKFEIKDGNEAAAYVAYRTNEICAIYPITPSSAMGEFADEWSASGIKNIFGTIPTVIEMQSEAGAAGTLHGSLQGGALSTTFTCSQGLLLMIPNMFKIAGELTPAVFQIAARALATHALSIFGDHSDVMAVRSTGFSMLFGNNPQEAMDMALIAQASTLQSRIPFLNIFDGFRTSHELNKVAMIPDEVMTALINPADVSAHRNRALNPEHPFIRGTAQNPDVFFQGREASNLFYQQVPEIVKSTMDRFAQLTGRQYHLFEYYGDKNAEDIIIIMGSGTGAVSETVDFLNKTGRRTGVLAVKLYRPFSVKDFIHAIPSTVKHIAVLDRCKESGAIGEPLYMDVCAALREDFHGVQPSVIGGRYGLASKEFNPGMVKAVFDELQKSQPKQHFTIGIHDDVSHTSLLWDEDFNLEEQHRFRGLFYGLGADGTVSANKNSIKIIGDCTDQYVQGYFVYDSKKSGSLTVSHLRFGEQPIRSTYLIQSANFVACHHFSYLTKYDVLKYAEKGATFLLNAPFETNEVWDRLPDTIQEEIIRKELKFFVINASAVARETGMGSRINTILQTCFFAISNVLPRELAISKIKEAIYKSYSRKGEAAVQKNYHAVDEALAHLHQIDYSKMKIGELKPEALVADQAPLFVKNVLGAILAGEGDHLPVSAFPVDGTYPSGTTQYEKRNIADKVPVWDADLCSQCGKCFIICPHAAIRCKVYDKSEVDKAPSNFKFTAPVGKEFDRESEVYTLQVAVEDCTGCNLCVEVCPIESKTEKGHKAINMMDQLPLREQEQQNWDFFLGLPDLDRERVNRNTVKGTQFYEPLFEFSGACSGCGETPYIKLLTQLFGDRMIVANATGCSSIFGGNLPTTPWTTNKEGHGPAWANSLFEDNAEFGLGLKLATDKKKENATQLLHRIKNLVGPELAEEILTSPETSEGDFKNRRKQITKLREVLRTLDHPHAKELLQLTDFLSDKSVWIIGGDGWAYDIGFSGLDHVLSTGEKVNILVLDTEVYSNTGGQKSKASPMGASAKFAIKGKQTSKKDLALQAIAHGNAYVAQIAIGANDLHTVRTLLEAEAFPGPSIVIAYSHCIAHGYDMAKGAEHQINAVKSGYWPLFRYNPHKAKGERFSLDSKDASIPVEDFLYKEQRFDVIRTNNPARAEDFLHREEHEIDSHWEKLLTLRNL